MTSMPMNLAAVLFATLTFPAGAQPDQKPKNATEWLQRAADQMNLRAFESRKVCTHSALDEGR